MINLRPLKVKRAQGARWIKQWWNKGEQPAYELAPEPEQEPKLESQIERGNLSALTTDEASLPEFVRHCPVTMKYLRLLGDLDWSNFPERMDGAWPGPKPHPRAPYVAAYVVKINEGHQYMTQLRRYLCEHPVLVWTLGFRLKPEQAELPYPFEVEAVVPSSKQLGRVLRELPAQMSAFLFQSTVKLLQAELPDEVEFGREISMDTKHIVAWVAENNPKAYVSESKRLNKYRQPKGDPDCKLCCKKRRNKPPADDGADDKPEAATPSPKSGKGYRPTNFSAHDVYYWGYASGIVATKVPEWGEFVLAELTQTFEVDDTAYFHPLMAQTEANLGFRPTNGAFDAAWDAWYVYHYFAQHHGIAAVPFSGKGGEIRLYSDHNLPLCEAGLPMPLKSTYIQRANVVIPKPQARYACPLLFPQPNGQTCPIDHHNWPKGGCLSTLGYSAGALMRHQLDRDGDAYKAIYKQRTATERINAQATEHGIERPKLRNFKAIARHNTLLYVLINLKALHRVRVKKAALLAEAVMP